MTIKEKLAKYEWFVDVGILGHGFAAHMRDYDIVFEALWGKKWEDKGTYHLRFSHCPEVRTTTMVGWKVWKLSWSDVFIDYDEWLAAGEPDGFVWGVCWSGVYPGVSYIDNSPRARLWSERLGTQMHEVIIKTEAFEIQIIFHDFTVTKLNDTVHALDKVTFPVSSVVDNKITIADWWWDER